MQQIGILHRSAADMLRLWAVMIALTLLLASCSNSPAAAAIEGKWTSSQSAIVFEFFHDGAYRITDPGNPFGEIVTGRYYDLDGGSSKNLSNVQFVLVGGYDIQFTPDGDAFFINIDGAVSNILYYHTSDEE